MVSFGERWLLTKVPTASELTNPITLVRIKLDPKTEGSNTEVTRTFEIYRKCWAKTEVSEVSTTGMYESFMREQKMCFTIRKAPKVIIKPKDYIIYKDKTYMIDEVIENRSWKEREYQVLTTTEVQDINAVAIEEVNKVESKGEIDYPGFFE